MHDLSAFPNWKFSEALPVPNKLPSQAAFLAAHFAHYVECLANGADALSFILAHFVSGFLRTHRRNATRAHTASIAPKGQAPCRKP